MFHEDSIAIIIEHNGITDSPEITQKYLAMYRRILKWIMEAGCDVKIKIIDVSENSRQRVEKILDKLLFLGDMIMT